MERFSIASRGMRLLLPLSGLATIFAFQAGLNTTLWLQHGSMPVAALVGVNAIIAGILLYLVNRVGRTYVFNSDGSLWIIPRSRTGIGKISTYSMGKDAHLVVEADRSHKNLVNLRLRLHDSSSIIKIGRYEITDLPPDLLKMIQLSSPQANAV